MRKNVKITILIVTVVLAVGLLFMQGMKADGSVGVYLTIEEALVVAHIDKDKYIQMEGTVIPESVDYDSTKPCLKFKLTDDKQNQIAVTFYDVKPDNFDSGYPIIVEGKFSADKEFLAEKLLVKCPSKYEEEVK